METTTSPAVSDSTSTTVSQSSFDDYAANQSLYSQVIIIALAVLAGCVLASIVLRWFHRG